MANLPRAAESPLDRYTAGNLVIHFGRYVGYRVNSLPAAERKRILKGYRDTGKRCRLREALEIFEENA
jgi:hypothetical protein